MGHADQLAFLRYLQSVVPRRDGRFLTKEEVEPNLREAAQILQQGELEAAVDGEVRTAREIWDDLQGAIVRAVEPFRIDITPLAGSISPAEHLAEVERAVLRHAQTVQFYGAQEDDLENRQVLEEALSEAVLAGFRIGRSFQAVSLTPVLRTASGDIGPHLDAMQEIEKLTAENESLRSDRDGALRDRTIILSKNKQLEKKAKARSYGTQKGGAVNQDRAAPWRKRALELRDELYAHPRFGRAATKKLIAAEVSVRLDLEKHKVKVDTVRSYFSSEDRKKRKG